jgi:hypothetical protein
MKQSPLWPIVVVFGASWALNIVAQLGVKWSLWRNRKKWESDEHLLFRYKEQRRDFEERGEAFDLWRKLAAAIARRDWSKAKKTLELAALWNAFIHWVTQLIILYFAYEAYGDDDLKLLVLLGLLFLWRSMVYHLSLSQRSHELIMAKLHWMNPTAESDFFKSEHCYDLAKDDRAWKLLKEDGYFDTKSQPPSARSTAAG